MNQDITPLPLSLRDELRRIEQDALFQAQANFDLATSKLRWTRLCLVGCSLMGGAAGLMVLLGWPGWIGVFAIIGNAVTGVAAAFGVQGASDRREAAGKQWTQLRREARNLRLVRARDITPDVFVAELDSLSVRFNDLVSVLPPLDQRALGRARDKALRGAPDEEVDEEASLSVAPTAAPPANRGSAYPPGSADGGPASAFSLGGVATRPPPPVGRQR